MIETYKITKDDEHLYRITKTIKKMYVDEILNGNIETVPLWEVHVWDHLFKDVDIDKDILSDYDILNNRLGYESYLDKKNRRKLLHGILDLNDIDDHIILRQKYGSEKYTKKLNYVYLLIRNLQKPTN